MKRESANVPTQSITVIKRTVTTLLLITAFSSFAISAQAETSRVHQYFNQVDTQHHQGNYSVISQVGNNNQVNVKQSYSAAYQTGNFSHIRQYGNENNASIAQTGGRNIGVILQAGNYHTANVSQSGSQQELSTYVSQTGTRSDIHVSQSGSGYRNIGIEQQAFSGYTRPVTVETY